MVQHFPRFPCGPFEVEVKDEYEALKMINTLADQHAWLFKSKIIPDYCNSFNVIMWDGSQWVDYWNAEEMMGWDDFETIYEDELTY